MWVGLTIPRPIPKDAIRSDPFGKFEGLKRFQLERKAVQVLKGVAIAYYTVTATYAPKAGRSEEMAFWYTHTSDNTNGVWLNIGGMSAPVQSLK